MPSQRIDTPKPESCKKCGGADFMSKGYSFTGYRVWRCKSCGKNTCNNGYTQGDQGMSKRIITDTLIAGNAAAAPDGYLVKGTSTLYDSDGKMRAQWVKTTADMEAQRLAQEAAFVALSQTLAPLPAVKAPRHLLAELLNLYTITDSHVGMLAWKKETGEPWDLEIAETCLIETFGRMIESAPPAETGVVNQLGDFLHFDSLQATTPTNHNQLDVDSRYQKVVEIAVRILRRIVSMALAKHKVVRVYMHEGNHDPAGSVWLRIMFAQLYANNPRVIVEKSPLPYIALQHGKTMLGFHHGHLARLGELPLLFAARFSDIWGGTEYRYIHTGHRHHVEEKEHPGIKVVQHSTLSAPDAYAARSGYLSKRQATSMTYSTEYGEVARAIFVPTR